MIVSQSWAFQDQKSHKSHEIPGSLAQGAELQERTLDMIFFSPLWELSA